MLECQFKFFKDTDSKYDVMYTLMDEKGATIDAGRVPYVPLHGPLKTMNEAKKKITQALCMRLKYTRPGVNIKMICKNPQSDFLTKSQMYWINKGMPTEEQPKVSCVATPDNNEQLFEVVEVGGIWTIKKHDEPYYTEAEAKTELFKRIVNGQ